MEKPGRTETQKDPAALLAQRGLVAHSVRVASWALLGLAWLAGGVLWPNLNSDGSAYWRSGHSVLYGLPWLSEAQGDPAPFVYSPAVAQALWPVTLLPLRAFMALWVAAQLACLAWLAGPVLAVGLLLLWPIGMTDVWNGSAYLPMAVALSLSLSHPQLWAVQILTKVTPGVGVLWHVGRREWSALRTALGTTAVIVAASFALWPGAWGEWIDLLRDAAALPGYPYGALPIPLAVRLPIAAVIVLLAARRGWPWLVPLGVMLAMPQVGWASGAVLLASLRLRSLAEVLDRDHERGRGRRRDDARGGVGWPDAEPQGHVAS